MRGSDSMNDLTLLGPWVRRFLLEHLVAERNLARNTQRSYRDALTLLIPFVADKLHPPVDRLTVVDVSADLVRLFLADLEQSRHCAITTRNQRLAAVHALAGFVGEHNPEHNSWCAHIRSISFKKGICSGMVSPHEAGTHCLVRTDPIHSVQEGQQGSYPLSGQTADGCAPGRARSRPPQGCRDQLCCCFSTTPGHAPRRPLRCS